MKLSVMYVSGGSWRDCFGRSIASFILMDGHERRIIDGFAFTNGLYVDQNRNSAVRSFLQSDAEWVLSLDTDIDFHWSVPYRLLDEADAKLRPIVSALYVGRIATFSPEGNPQPPRVAPMFYSRTSNGMWHSVGELHNRTQEIDGMGMGCCVIHRSVFEGFPDQEHSRPWFACEDRYVEGCGWMFVGEDLVFCDRAQQAGFRIYGDSRIQVGHDKSDLLTVEHLIAENKK